MSSSSPQPLVLMAGEPSGDILGSRLMAALKKQAPNKFTFYGVGGAEMLAEGLNPFFPLADLNIMGLTETVSKVGIILKRLRDAKKKILQLNPSAVITIDFPGFNFRLARALRGHGIPLIHYVAPTIWARHKDKRGVKFAQVYDHLLSLFPFEAPFFKDVPLPISFVGHPVMELSAPQNGQPYRDVIPNPGEKIAIAVLPGSRMSEVRKLIPIFQQTIHLLKTKYPKIEVKIPVVPEVASYIESTKNGWDVPVEIVCGPLNERQKIYEQCWLALAASGSISFELARAQLPMLITYKVSRLTAFIAKRILAIKYVCLLNLLQDKLLVPEFLQENCQPERLSVEMIKLLESPLQRSAQITATQKSLSLLKPKEGYPSERAAQVVLTLLNSKK